MATMIIRHRVKDHAGWRKGFEAHIENRRAGGEKAYRILHPADEPDNLTVIFEWDSADRARAFLEDPKLKEAMEAAGVMEAPDVSILEEVDRGVTQ